MVTRITKDENGQPMDLERRLLSVSLLTDANRIYFASRQGQQSHYYYYSFETDSVTELPYSGDSWPFMVVSKNDKVYLKMDHQIALWSEQDNSFNPLPSPPRECSDEDSIASISDNGMLLLYHCNTLYSYDPESGEYLNLQALLPGLPHGKNPVTLSGDGRFLIKIINDIVYRYNLETYARSTLHLRQYGFSSQGTYGDGQVSQDGSLLFLSLMQNNLISADQGEQEVSLHHRLFGVINLEDSDPFPIQLNLVQSDSSGSGQEIELSSVRYDGANDTLLVTEDRADTDTLMSWSVAITELQSLWNNRPDNLATLEATNSATHSNQITVIDDHSQALYKIIVTSERTGQDRILWLKGSSFLDKELGLTVGLNHYQLFSCGPNLNCSTTSSPKVSLTTQDFVNDDRWQISTSADDVEFNTLIELTGLDWPDATNTNIKKFHEGDEEWWGLSTKTLGTLSNQLKIGIRPCTNFYSGCAQWLSVKSFDLPAMTEPPLALLDTQYEYVSVWFDMNEQYQYHIERATYPYNNGYDIIAQNTQSGWQDETIVPGSEYHYRLMVCDPVTTYCRRISVQVDGYTWPSYDITIERQSDLRIKQNYTFDNNGALTFDIFNRYDVDHFIVSRGLRGEEYEQIAIVPGTALEFVDPEPLPGASRWYRLQSMKDNQVFQTAIIEGNFQRNSIADIQSDSLVTGLTLDESIAWGTMVSWDPVPDAQGYVLRLNWQQSAGSKSSVYTLSSTETAQFVPFDEINISKEIEYSLSPVLRQCQENAWYCEEEEGTPQKIQGVRPAIALQDKTLTAPVLNVAHINPDSLKITHKRSFVFDSYKLSRRTMGSDNWQVISYSDSTIHYEPATIVDRHELQLNAEYQYQMEVCSIVIDTCATSFSDTVKYHTTRVSGAPQAPIVTLLDDRFEVALQSNPEGYFSRVEIALTRANEDTFIRNVSSIQRPDNKVEIDYHPFYNYAAGKEVQFKIRYCFDERDYGHSHEHDCSEYSDIVTRTLPDTRHNNAPSLAAFTTEQDVDANQIEISASFRENDGQAPHSIFLYRAVNSETLTVINTHITSEQEPVIQYEFVDTDVTAGNWYQYAIRACNENDCVYSALLMDRFSDEAPSLPAVPVVTFVSQGLSRDSIDLKVERSPTADSYRFYRASEQQGEYRQVGTLSSSSNEYRDYNLTHSTRYWYQVEACNLAGCVRTEPFSASTSSYFHSDNIQIDNATLYAYWRSHDSRINLYGLVSPQFGQLDVFTGEIHFNQWLNLTQGMQLNKHAYLYGSWSECSRVLDYSLHLPNFGSSQDDESYGSRIGSVLYTGDGCMDDGELEPSSFYFDSEYLSEPVKIDMDLRESWADFSLVLDANGLIRFSINDVEIAFTDTPVDMNIFYLSQLRVNLQSSNYLSSGLQSFSFSTGKTTQLNNSLLLSEYQRDYSLSVLPLHPRVIAARLNQYTDGVIEYRKVNDQQFSEPDSLQLSNGGEYNGYIRDLTPDTEHNFVMRYCLQKECGPYHYVNSLTYRYQELDNAPAIEAILSTDSPQVMVSLSSRAYNAQVVDTFTFYKQVIGVDEEPVILSAFDYNQRHDHWLENSGEYILIDTPEQGTSVRYSLMVCNVIGCSSTASETSLDLPLDIDNDGVYDPFDAFPDDPGESSDHDRDGIGDNADPDDDNDNIPDIDEIALGLDPLDRWDASSDSDNDGFRNFFEFYAGTDLHNADSHPEQSAGFYTNFATEEETNIAKNVNIFQSFYDSTFSVGRDIYTDNEPNVTIRLTGQLNDGYLIFSENYYIDRRISIRIDGQEIASTTGNLLQPGVQNEGPFKTSQGDFSWWHVAYPLSATSKPVTLELSLYGHEDYPTGVFLNEIFIPFATTLPSTDEYVAADFDGDEQADYVVRNAQIGVNYVLSTQTDILQRHTFGSQENDIILDGDFNGDGIADVALRRPGNTTWYIQNSGNSDYNSARQDGIQRISFGLKADDIPVPADYDGDGVTDIAVRRPDNYTWYIQNSDRSNYRSERRDGIQRVVLGKNRNDIPVPADYDGDGKADIAVRRPENHMWYILESSTSEIRRVQFGRQNTDIPVPADYDGDGKTDIAVRRPKTQMWYILRSSDEQIMRINFGKQSSDIPVVGDYDGDGMADIAVRRPNAAMWYVLKSSDNQILRQQFGRHDHMVPSLAPIWQKLIMSGWQNEYLFGVSGSLAGKAFQEDQETTPLIMISPVDDAELGVNDRVAADVMEFDSY